MRLDIRPDGIVMVTLSRRNLRSLLTKLDQPGSFRTLVSENAYDEDGDQTLAYTLVLRAESDDLHYATRGFPPGLMHPDTERAIADLDWTDDREGHE